MPTAPMPPSNHPHQDAGSPGGPFPPPPPQPPRRQSWFGRQSEAVRITIIGAVIAGVFSLAGAVLTVALTDKGEGPSEAKAPTQPPSVAPTNGAPDPTTAPPPTSEASSAPQETESDTASPDESSTATTPAPAAYTALYTKQAMALGLPAGSDLGSIDFDAPATRRYTEDEWNSVKEKGEQSGVPVEADLTYQNPNWGYLVLRNGRNAAQLPAANPPEKAADCARAAQVGGFTEEKMSDWKLPAKTVLCVVTDKGNIARVVITGFIGGDPDSYANPPKQLSLEVTLWKPAA
ncbi:hypothetical protein ACHGLA_23600 [Streptomyces sp. YH02]|uniref:hypothetical protein n=1 Tax=Streptomyces sp. YH02 TaxID=3256999 RepID=UPI00375840EE